MIISMLDGINVPRRASDCLEKDYAGGKSGKNRGFRRDILVG